MLEFRISLLRFTGIFFVKSTQPLGLLCLWQGLAIHFLMLVMAFSEAGSMSPELMKEKNQRIYSFEVKIVADGVGGLDCLSYHCISALSQHNLSVFYC